MTATKDKFFKPAKLTGQQKTSLTDDAARKIVEAEAAAREKKTEKLRLLRLERERLAPIQVAPTPSPKKTKK